MSLLGKLANGVGRAAMFAGGAAVQVTGMAGGQAILSGINAASAVDGACNGYMNATPRSKKAQQSNTTQQSSATKQSNTTQKNSSTRTNYNTTKRTNSAQPSHYILQASRYPTGAGKKGMTYYLVRCPKCSKEMLAEMDNVSNNVCSGCQSVIELM